MHSNLGWGPLCRFLAFEAFASTLACAAKLGTPGQIGSSITHLFHNNLNWTDDANHASFLLLNAPLSYEAAHAGCAALGESLLTTSSAKAAQSDLGPELSYALYRQGSSSTQKFWLSDGVVTASAQGGSLEFSGKPSANTQLPAVCTQSASGTTDTTSVATVGNEVNVTNPSNGNTYVGFRNHKSFRFLGIPYSNNPARWTYSSVSSTQDSVVEATTFGDECWQAGSAAYSEDCLFLNVFTPHIPASTKATTELRPVLFWIHGGAFTSGTGADPTFDGGNMASRGDVVVVTINYRLTTLGFLAIPGTNITGNYGIADQITALEWVQANIKAFGGDPSRVTINGQSAGAGSVRALLASPKARGLFSAAIPASNLGGYDYATTYSLYYTPSEEYNTAAEAILQETGCTNNNTAQEVSCLNSVSPSTLVNLADVARYVIVDGTYITSTQLNVTTPGQAAYVPVLWGSMAEDGAPFISYPAEGSTRTDAIYTILYGEPSVASAVISDTSLFPLPSGSNATLDVFNLTARLATDVEFRCIDQATVHSAIQNGILPTAYYYQFDRSYQTPGWDPNAPTCDAPVTASHPHGDPSLPYFRCHSGDLMFEFGTLGQFNLGYRDQYDLPFMQLVMDYWTSFVRAHNPNPDAKYLAVRGYTNTSLAIASSGTWEPVSATADTLRRLDYPSKQDTFQELTQCQVLGLPVNYYDNGTSTS